MNIFRTMVKLQHEFNLQLHPIWWEQSFTWQSAIIVESGELLESWGYKWWKKQDRDILNVKVEAIDLLHFVIAKNLEDHILNRCSDVNSGVNVFAERFEAIFSEEIDPFEYCNEDMEALVFLLVDRHSNQIRILKYIFAVLKMSPEDVYIAYITKNCLNKFRQDNGYKDGTYIKMWNDKEDNEVAFSFAEQIGVDDELYSKLYLILDDYYKNKVITQ